MKRAIVLGDTGKTVVTDWKIAFKKCQNNFEALL